MRGKRAAFQSALRRHTQHLRLYPESGEEEVVASMLTLMYGPKPWDKHSRVAKTNQFLMCLALQKGLVDNIIDNREFDILIDRLDLREEHNKCPFMGVGRTMKQQAHGPVPGVQTTIINNAVSAVKAFDSEMSSHVLRSDIDKGANSKNEIQRFFNQLPSDPRSITHSMKLKWSALMDARIEDSVEKFTHECIYNQDVVDTLFSLLCHDNRIVFAVQENYTENHVIPFLHTVLLRTLLDSGREAHTNAYTCDRVLAGLCRLVTMLAKNQFIPSMYQFTTTVVHPLLRARAQYASVYIVYGTSIFDVLAKHRNKYNFPEVMYKYTCFQMKSSMESLLNQNKKLQDRALESMNRITKQINEYFEQPNSKDAHK